VFIAGVAGRGAAAGSGGAAKLRCGSGVGFGLGLAEGAFVGFHMIGLNPFNVMFGQTETPQLDCRLVTAILGSSLSSHSSRDQVAM
jgi:hypothetical protein